MSRQYQQLQDRANALDRDNQEIDTLLAQARQQVKVSDDELAALRDQLRTSPRNWPSSAPIRRTSTGACRP